MWELNCEESWVPKNWCFWTVVLEKTLESPLDCKEIQPVHSKGDQSWIFIGRMLLKLKRQYSGYLMQRTDSLEKTLMLGKIEGGRSIGVSALASVLPKNTQDSFPLGWICLMSLPSNGLSRVFSNTIDQKHQFFSAQLSLWSNFHVHTWLLEKP